MMTHHIALVAQLGLTGEEWLREFMLCLVTVAIPALLLFAAVDLRRICRRGQLAGELLFNVRAPWWLSVITAGVGVMAVVVIVLLVWIGREILDVLNLLGGGGRLLNHMILVGVASKITFMLLSLGSVLLYWRIHLELRRRGVWFGRQFVPWSNVTRAFWTKKGTLRLELVTHYQLFSIRQNAIEPVNAILREYGKVVDQTDPDCSTLPTRKLRAFHIQSTLRGVLFIFAVVGMALALFAKRVDDIRANHRIAVRLEARGGKLELSQGRIWSIDLSVCNPKATDDDLADLKQLRHLVFLALDATEVSDAGLAHLASLTDLCSLSLGNTRVSDTGLAHLAGLVKLDFLMLQGTGITDAGLEHLERLTRLKYLLLGNTQITGAGLQHLGALTNLEILSLSGTNVDDAGLAHLVGLHSLKSLGLGRTLITNAGVKHLAPLACLNSLDLSDTKITDRALDDLRRMTHLEHLGLERIDISKQGIEALQKALPKAEVEFTDVQAPPELEEEQVREKELQEVERRNE